MTTNNQRKWKVYIWACFSPTNGTGITGKLSFQEAATPDVARAKIGHKIYEEVTRPGIDFIFDSDNFIVLIKPIETETE